MTLPMTLEELIRETLVQKHQRLMQAKCRHPEVYSSTVAGPTGTFTNSHCLDCGKSWHREGIEDDHERDRTEALDSIGWFGVQ